MLLRSSQLSRCIKQWLKRQNCSQRPGLLLEFAIKTKLRSCHYWCAKLYPFWLTLAFTYKGMLWQWDHLSDHSLQTSSWVNVMPQLPIPPMVPYTRATFTTISWRHPSKLDDVVTTCNKMQKPKIYIWD